MTHLAIAKLLGVSAERVRQLERSAIAKLSHPRNMAKWKKIKEIMAEIEKERALRDNERIVQ
ncbi:RNA polymerase subunit sigma-70 [Campylobacter sp. RM12920]|uniref:RNA polymerase subunit sigma-70 n=1 Tax=Campylobacter californiensis TaxID=1032243 RepID=A0ABD4JFR9_9BACT|nr:RNA polymerase subunit sigma-70 [Campylobacter sp. RM12919]MBE2987441.1 RNA polymerase subunit sigma-70 [Campylobacter sp. RM12920]